MNRAKIRAKLTTKGHDMQFEVSRTTAPVAGSVTGPTPWDDNVAELVADFQKNEKKYKANKNLIPADTFKAVLNRDDVLKIGRELSQALKNTVGPEANLMIRKKFSPDVITPSRTNGRTDDAVERTVHFWIDDFGNRGRKAAS